MKISSKEFVIKLGEYYYAGKNEDVKTAAGGLGGAALGYSTSIPILTKEKSKAKIIGDVFTLKTMFSELIDAIRFQYILKSEDIDNVEIEIL